MSTTEQQLAANRTNALKSTGPTTVQGKATVSRNAKRHGLLSAKLFLDDENPAEFDDLLGHLCRTLKPVGAIEEALVERIAVTVWRQRRLVAAETANICLARQTNKVAVGVASELGRGYGSEVDKSELEPLDQNHEHWCRNVLKEIEDLDEISIKALKDKAPFTFAQLETEAQEDSDEPEAYVGGTSDGLASFLAELLKWCREEIRKAEARPHLLMLAEQVRTKRLVLPTETLELLARYQTTLDNQLYRALRALREAQEWRLKTLEAEPAPATGAEQDLANAA